MSVLQRTFFVLGGALLSACSVFPDRYVEDRRIALDLIDAGSMQLEQGFLDQAYASFEMAFEKYPLPEALDGLGCVELYEGHIAKAKELFKLALDSDPEYYRAIGHLALVAELEEQPEEAARLYRESLLFEPDNVRARNNYAVFLLDSGNSKESIDMARRELLRANSFEPHPTLIENFKKIESTYGSGE